MSKRSNKGIKIAPSLLAADFGHLAEQVSAAEAAGADWLHIDVMDGRFVPNITMGALVVEAVARAATIPLDVHLMIVEPERYITQFADAGAQNIAVHIEACAHLHRVIEQITEAGCRPGVALNPHTPVSALAEVLPMLALVTVMTVNPGFGGQRFIPSMRTKVRRLRALAQEGGYDLEIAVDGGIQPGNIADVAHCGASVAIAGTCVFQHEHSIAAGMDELRAALRDSLY